MNNLTQTEIARVFAMYYFAECRTVQYPPYEKGTVDKIGAIPKDAEYFKLLLKPLSAISDEDAIEVAKLSGWNDAAYYAAKNDSFSLKTKGVAIIENVINAGYELGANEFQFLIQQGYAAPLFHGVNHPDNGKTAIELGLAQEIAH